MHPKEEEINKKTNIYNGNMSNDDGCSEKKIKMGLEIEFWALES